MSERFLGFTKDIIGLIALYKNNESKVLRIVDETPQFCTYPCTSEDFYNLTRYKGKAEGPVILTYSQIKDFKIVDELRLIHKSVLYIRTGNFLYKYNSNRSDGVEAHFEVYMDNTRNIHYKDNIKMNFETRLLGLPVIIAPYCLLKLPTNIQRPKRVEFCKDSIPYLGDKDTKDFSYMLSDSILGTPLCVDVLDFSAWDIRRKYFLQNFCDAYMHPNDFMLFMYLPRVANNTPNMGHDFTTTFTASSFYVLIMQEGAFSRDFMAVRHLKPLKIYDKYSDIVKQEDNLKTELYKYCIHTQMLGIYQDIVLLYKHYS